MQKSGAYRLQSSTGYTSISRTPHYSPFGSLISNRSWSDASREYRYGFNGKEKDFETSSDYYDFGARIFDGRLGRWLSLDPLMKKYVEISPFTYCINNPIRFIDKEGKEVIETDKFQESKYSKVLEELLRTNQHFCDISSKFTSKYKKLTFGIDNTLVPTGKSATTTYRFGGTELIKIFEPNGINKIPSVVVADINFTSTSSQNLNNLGMTILISHEILHAKAGLNGISGDDVNHTIWDDYFSIMQGIVNEYNIDHNLGLTSTQVKELSIFNCGKGAKIYDDYIAEQAAKNKTTIEVEEKAFKDRINSLILIEIPAVESPVDEETAPSDEAPPKIDEDKTDDK